MLCQECRRNEANIHIVKNINGNQSELNLCEHCARKKEELDFSFEPKFSLHKLFAGLLEQNLLGDREAIRAADASCPGCGLTFSHFGQIGRLGCSSCVAAFEENLRPLLRRIHGGSRHTGKVPARALERVKNQRELDRLKEDLKAKVEGEEFEEAALLRDKIRVMEKEIHGEVEPGHKDEDHDDSEKGDQMWNS